MAHSKRATFKLLSASISAGLLLWLSPLVRGWQHHPKVSMLAHRQTGDCVTYKKDSRFTTSRQALYYSSDDENMEYIPKLFSSTTGAGSWEGAGLPRPDLPPEEIPSLLMKSLRLNDFPDEDAGLNSLWNFSSGMLRQRSDRNVTAFIQAAHQDAEQCPASFYGMALNGLSWELETEMNRIGGEAGYLATQVVKTISADGRMRRFQFMLRRNRRPPDLNCWFVESVGASDRTGNFNVDD